jgi:DNA-directed RNA polymerase specialized sigma24 family protein
MSDPQPDFEFISLRDRAHAGDRTAFNALFRHVDRVFKRQARMRLERQLQSKFTESDVLQEVLLIAWQHFNEFQRL